MANYIISLTEDGKYVRGGHRERIDSAYLFAKRLAYAALSDNGILDTARAHIAMNGLDALLAGKSFNGSVNFGNSKVAVVRVS